MTTYTFDAKTFSKDGEAFVGDFCLIPETYSTLNLKQCALNEKAGYYLNRALSALPISITDVDLSLNSLHLKTADEIKFILSGFNNSVKRVTLNYNGLSDFSEAVLVDIISSMKFVQEVSIIERTFALAAHSTLAERLHQLTGKKIITTIPQSQGFFGAPHTQLANASPQKKPSPSN